MINPENNQSVFVWGHYAKKLEQLDKERFKVISQLNAHIIYSRIYNKRVGYLVDEIYSVIDMDISDKQKYDRIDIILNKIEHENYLDTVFREFNKLMLSFGDSVSFGSAATGQLERLTKHGKIVKPKDKIVIG